MALEQTLAQAKNIVLCSPRNPMSNIHIPSLSPNLLSPIRLFSSAKEPYKNRQLSIHGGVKCSMDYNNNNNNHYDGLMGPQYPRPSEMQWKKEFCNSVQLIGIVVTPVQIKPLSSGKVLAWSRLAIKKSSTDTAWINLTLWDELAHVAFQHIEKGHQLYISSRLVSDAVDIEDGNKKLSNYAVNNTGSTKELWQAFFANPVDWWDNRKNKRNPKYPDFKHKDTGEALWIEGRYNPPWVKSQLAILDTRIESFHDQNDGMPVNFVAGDYTTF